MNHPNNSPVITREQLDRMTLTALGWRAIGKALERKWAAEKLEQRKI